MGNHQQYIKKTYQLALQAQNRGNHPFGALLVMETEIVLTAENTVNTENDITKHAELNLVSSASKKWNATQLNEATLYTSTEPCAMCSGAIFWAGISAVVYGCSAKKLGEITTGSFVIPCQHVFNYGKRQTSVIGPILEAQGADIHQGFWT